MIHTYEWDVDCDENEEDFGIRVGDLGMGNSKSVNRKSEKGPKEGRFFLPQRRRASFAKAREAKKRGGVFVNVKVNVNGNLGGGWRGV